MSHIALHVPLQSCRFHSLLIPQRGVSLSPTLTSFLCSTTTRFITPGGKSRPPRYYSNRFNRAPTRRRSRTRLPFTCLSQTNSWFPMLKNSLVCLRYTPLAARVLSDSHRHLWPLRSFPVCNSLLQRNTLKRSTPISTCSFENTLIKPS